MDYILLILNSSDFSKSILNKLIHLTGSVFFISYDYRDVSNSLFKREVLKNLKSSQYSGSYYRIGH